MTRSGVPQSLQVIGGSGDTASRDGEDARIAFEKFEAGTRR
jgi:hypothetical protein